MAHRLLHTLVVSSTLLLDACGSAATSSERPAPEAAAGGEETARNGETPAPVAVGGSASGALATCEPGWPTTKGSSCSVDASGITVCCSSYVPATGVACCAQPQSPPSSGSGY